MVIQTTLRAKQKLSFINGTMMKSDDDASKLEDWWTMYSMIVSWVLNTIEARLRSAIMYFDLWTDLR